MRNRLKPYAWHAECVCCRFMPSFRVRALLALVVLVACLGLTQCGSGSTTLLSPTEQRSTLTITPGNATAGANGGTGTLAVTTSRECRWNASTTASWLKLGATDGQG